jgi:hypothetical protein
MSPDWDSDLKKRKEESLGHKRMQEAIAAKAKSNSKSPFQGMDGVDYEGSNRWNYNISKAKAGMAQLKINKADAEQATRNNSRARYVEQMSKRQRKFK